MLGFIRVHVLVEVKYGHVGSLAGEENGDGAADTRISSTDNGYLSFELFRATIERCIVHGWWLKRELMPGLSQMLAWKRRLRISSRARLHRFVQLAFWMSLVGA